jgi:hypothetical protein
LFINVIKMSKLIMAVAAAVAIVGLANRQVPRSVGVNELNKQENNTVIITGTLIGSGDSYYVSDGINSYPIGVNNPTLEGGVGVIKLVKQGNSYTLLSFNKRVSSSELAQVQTIRRRGSSLFGQLNGEYIQLNK